jgi:hypothetical protein
LRFAVVTAETESSVEGADRLGRFAAWALTFRVAPVALVPLVETPEEEPEGSFVDAGGADGMGAAGGEGTAEATVGRGFEGSVNCGRS